MANRFYQNRMAIKAISEKEGVDVDIASRMYAQQQGWTGWEKEMDEWNDIQRSYMKSKTRHWQTFLSKRGFLWKKRMLLCLLYIQKMIFQNLCWTR